MLFTSLIFFKVKTVPGDNLKKAFVLLFIVGIVSFLGQPMIIQDFGTMIGSVIVYSPSFKLINWFSRVVVVVVVAF